MRAFILTAKTQNARKYCFCRQWHKMITFTPFSHNQLWLEFWIQEIHVFMSSDVWKNFYFLLCKVNYGVATVPSHQMTSNSLFLSVVMVMFSTLSTIDIQAIKRIYGLGRKESSNSSKELDTVWHITICLKFLSPSYSFLKDCHHCTVIK